MQADEGGVGGFFEDLPVLVFVLAGTCTLVLSGVRVSEEADHVRELGDLVSRAERFVCLFLSEILTGHSDSLPSVGYVSSTNLSRIAAEVLRDRDYSVGVAVLYPAFEWLCGESSSDTSTAANTGFASRLFNALTGDGLTAILVVNVLVW